MSHDTWGSSAAGAAMLASPLHRTGPVHMLGDPNKETKQVLKLFSPNILSERAFTKPDLFSTIKTMNTECQKGHES